MVFELNWNNSPQMRLSSNPNHHPSGKTIAKIDPEIHSNSEFFPFLVTHPSPTPLLTSSSEFCSSIEGERSHSGANWISFPTQNYIVESDLSVAHASCSFRAGGVNSVYSIPPLRCTKCPLSKSVNGGIGHWSRHFLSTPTMLLRLSNFDCTFCFPLLICHAIFRLEDFVIVTSLSHIRIVVIVPIFRIMRCSSFLTLGFQVSTNV